MIKIPVIYLPDLGDQFELYSRLYDLGVKYYLLSFADGWTAWQKYAASSPEGYPHVYLDSLKRVYTYHFNAALWKTLPASDSWTVVNSPKQFVRYARAHILA